MEYKIQRFSNLQVKKEEGKRKRAWRKITDWEQNNGKALLSLDAKGTHSAEPVLCLSTQQREKLNTEKKKWTTTKCPSNTMSFKPALSSFTTHTLVAGPQYPILIRLLGAHFLMLNSEMRLRRLRVVFSYNGNVWRKHADLQLEYYAGFGCAPAWLP